MSKIKNPSVAGVFYPKDKEGLENILSQYLSAEVPVNQSPKAIIAPHAGYIYSGIVAARAFKCLEKMPKIQTVILLGPSHFVGFKGVAYCDAEAFVTPLGSIPVNLTLLDKVKSLAHVNCVTQAFLREHALEVQFPFLQKTLDTFSIVPLLVGTADKDKIAEVLALLWGDESTLIIISSDLSHYHNYETAQALDQKTTSIIERLMPNELAEEDACGRAAIRGLLEIANQKKMKVNTLMQINSGDTAGSKDRVVGYGAYHFIESEAGA